jgi:hypothetical protein
VRAWTKRHCFDFNFGSIQRQNLLLLANTVDGRSGRGVLITRKSTQTCQSVRPSLLAAPNVRDDARREARSAFRRRRRSRG